LFKAYQNLIHQKSYGTDFFVRAIYVLLCHSSCARLRFCLTIPSPEGLRFAIFITSLFFVTHIPLAFLVIKAKNTVLFDKLYDITTIFAVNSKNAELVGLFF